MTRLDYYALIVLVALIGVPVLSARLAYDVGYESGHKTAVQAWTPPTRPAAFVNAPASVCVIEPLISLISHGHWR